MAESNIYSESDMDAFKEMGNIGAGHAAIALTSLLSKEVDMSAPFVRVGSPEYLISEINLDKDEIVGHEILEIKDTIRYKLGIVFRKSVILNLLESFSSTSRDNLSSPEDLSDMQASLIQEIGSVIILRYIAALNKMLKIETIPNEAPKFKVMTALESVSDLGFEGQSSNSIILIQLDLFTDEKEFNCHIFVQPHHESLDAYRQAFFG